MNQIARLLRNAGLLAAGLSIAMSSPAVHAEVLPGASASGLVSAQFGGTTQWQTAASPAAISLNKLSGTGLSNSLLFAESRFELLAGSDFAEIAQRYPFIFFASLLSVPEASKTKSVSALLFVSSTAVPADVPAPVPLPLPAVLLLSGLGALLGARRRGAMVGA